VVKDSKIAPSLAITNPYRPPVRATSSDNIQFVVESCDEFPTGRAVINRDLGTET